MRLKGREELALNFISMYNRLNINKLPPPKVEKDKRTTHVMRCRAAHSLVPCGSASFFLYAADVCRWGATDEDER